MNKSTLYNHLTQYRKTVYPFHMPGHKLNRMFNIKNIIDTDVTEVDGTDNLHHPKGIIRDAQEKASYTFGARNTFFLVNGSTSGIISSISAICQEKDKILISRNSHKSVYNGVILNDLEPIYLYPEIDHSNGIVGGINPHQVEEKLLKYPDVKLVVITSPTYEGFVYNIEKIADIVHRYNKILMIDEAHGAHFRFHNNLPKTAMEQGADIVIQSIHKTLPAFTQSAMLHINYNNIDCDEIQDKLSIFQSSSPSYILMTSLDNCREILDTKGRQMFKKYMMNLIKCRTELKNKLKHLKLIDDEVIGTNHISDIDYSKIVIDCSKADITGIELDKTLRNEYKIQVELSNINHIIAMTSVCDSKKGFKRLQEAIIKIDSKLQKENKKAYKYDIIDKEHKYYNPKIAYNMEKEVVELENSIGKISGEFIIPFPPGIPLIIPGEKISEENINLISIYKKLNIELMGLKDSEINTIRIIKEV